MEFNVFDGGELEVSEDILNARDFEIYMHVVGLKVSNGIKSSDSPYQEATSDSSSSASTNHIIIYNIWSIPQ